MYALATHPLLTLAALIMSAGSALLALFVCTRLVGWRSPLKWISMWLVLSAGSFVSFSSYGPLNQGPLTGSSSHLWEPSLFGLAFAVAVASAGTIGIWRSNH